MIYKDTQLYLKRYLTNKHLLLVLTSGWSKPIVEHFSSKNVSFSLRKNEGFSLFRIQTSYIKIKFLDYPKLSLLNGLL